MKTKLVNTVFKIQDNFIITVLRHGLSMMIPFILIGGISNGLINLPIEGYQTFINSDGVRWLRDILYIMYKGTFGLFSVAIVIALSLSYAMERNETPDVTVMYVIVALGAFGAQLNIGGKYFVIDNLGVTGYFSAILISLVSCAAFTGLRKVKWLSLSEFTVGMEGICANAIHSFLPALIIIAVLAGISQIFILVAGVSSLQEIISQLFIALFNGLGLKNGFFSGLLYTFLLHILWFMGFHGSHVLEPVALDLFAFTGNGQLFSKSFFDVFVVMGGCGTTICVLFILLFFYRKHRLGNLAKIATPTVIFNMNEMLNFGIPVILNPILLIPFIVTPIVCYCVSYLAVYIGVVPTMCNEMVWTTPIFFSGYKATDSIRGTLLQVVTVLTGMAIYFPFIRLHMRTEEIFAKEQLKRLVKEFQACEEKNETPGFLQRTDKLGLICKVLLKDMKIALEKDEIFLLYQPQMDDDGRCIGAEALLRWEHPLYGFIYPPLIIYLAKSGNVLEELERKIFDTATSAIKKTSDAYDGEFKISVNITAKSLLWDIEGCIKECVDRYGIEAKRLWIEITEQDVITRADDIIDKLNRLRNVGHTLLIDDFGMGHTSLLYLQSNFFNVVKLDGSLVKNLLKNNTNQKIVESIVELGRSLDIRVIAEYVENEEQRQLLSRLGCKWYQGYLFSRPIKLDEFIDYIVKKNKKE